jgi:hypothetical protein
LGVDEHVWHHVSTKPVEQGGRGPKDLTGMVDLTPDRSGRVRARLLDLQPGRSGTVYADWLQARGDAFRARVQVATLDPFHGYKNAMDNQLDDAVAVLDAFHVVALASKALDQVRRRVQQEIHGHRDQARSQEPIMHVTCGNRGAACENRTHDLRITRFRGHRSSMFKGGRTVRQRMGRTTANGGRRSRTETGTETAAARRLGRLSVAVSRRRKYLRSGEHLGDGGRPHGTTVTGGRLCSITSDAPPGERNIVSTNLYVRPDADQLRRLAAEAAEDRLTLDTRAVRLQDAPRADVRTKVCSLPVGD